MPFIDSNIASGILQNAAEQIGITNNDNGAFFEDGVSVPWCSNPAASYLYFDCTIGVMLDSGIVIHNRLPQVNHAPDTIGAVDIDDPNIAAITGIGVNLRCNDQYRDIVQRMGHSRYWFRIWGEALRAGYQVPIPVIKEIGGVKAIPYDRNPQWAFNRIFPGANFGGIPLWHAQWSLWFTTIDPPNNNDIPATDLTSGTWGTNQVPDSVQLPYSTSDSSSIAVQSNAGTSPGFAINQPATPIKGSVEPSKGYIPPNQGITR